MALCMRLISEFCALCPLEGLFPFRQAPALEVDGTMYAQSSSLVKLVAREAGEPAISCSQYVLNAALQCSCTCYFVFVIVIVIIFLVTVIATILILIIVIAIFILVITRTERHRV